MESTVSVSKGVFLFKNSFATSKQTKRKTNLFQKLFKKEPWYTTYKSNWEYFENEIQKLHHRTYSVLLNDIVSYVKSFYGNNEYDIIEGIVPSATLLTGVNQPDHVSQFVALVDKIRDEVTPHIAMVNSQDASSLKHLVENAVWQLIHGTDKLSMEDDDSENSFTQKKKLKKSQCTMRVLQNWYNAIYTNASPKKKKQMVSNRLLVIIIPDFESFNCSILQDFVMIVSSYVTSLPIVFVFGVATSVSALHKSFPYHVSSKLLIKVFHSHSSPIYMNQVLEEIYLTHTSPFHLSGKAFELLTDVFLFYDFSVTGLIQSIKYCMMDHFYGDNIKSLCCPRDKIEEAVMNLTSDDLESIRQLMSFRPFVEAQMDCQTKIGLFEDENFFREVLVKELHKFHDYLYTFFLSVRLLLCFAKDIPKNILGKSVREIYTKCATECITTTPEFRECMMLVKFQSQVKLIESIKNALKIVNAALKIVSPVKPLRSTPTKNNLSNIALNNDLGDSFVKTIRVHLLMFLRQIENANTEACSSTKEHEEFENDTENVPGNRYKLKEKLLKATRADRIQSEFEMVRSRFVSYLDDMFTKGLQPPYTQTFHEIFFFTDVGNVRKQIVGSPRGAQHTALSNPVHYLQCACCILPSVESVSATLPDVSVAYKLHRECGKHINLYDWLQAFIAVLRPEDERPEHDAQIQILQYSCCILPSVESVSATLPDVSVAYKLHRECGKHINLYDWLQAFIAVLRPEDERPEHDAQIQVRFTRAVAELQFLGFIKSSKRKTDHVMRLTW